MAKVIIYDFEVFKYDTLLGAKILEDGKDPILFQSWDLDKIYEFYKEHINDIFVGWNSQNYDCFIMQAIVNHQNPYLVSSDIIKKTNTFKKLTIPLYDYDLLNSVLNIPSLKVTEAFVGKSIDVTEVDFNIDRKLTEEEKKLTEKYNQSDLNQTEYNFYKFYDKFSLRLMLIKEFGLNTQRCLHSTDTTLAGLALKCKNNPSLAFVPDHPRLYPCLQIKDKEVIEFYMSERWRKGDTLVKEICGTKVVIAKGGMHSDMGKYHCKLGYHADIQSYYPNIMMHYDLLPRCMDDESKKLYKRMYDEQIRLKKIDPKKRVIYKKICNSVYGAMNAEGTAFFDPNRTGLVALSGEMFLYDLLEKLDGLCVAFNVNTDGIMVDPYHKEDLPKIEAIIKDWTERIGFPIEMGPIENYRGRDVNCYVMQEEGQIVTKGGNLTNYDISDKAYSSFKLFPCTEPPIIAQGIVNALINDIPPETFVEQNKENLILFQYIAKKVNATYLVCSSLNLNKFKDNVDLFGNVIIPSNTAMFEENRTIPSPSRIFPSNDKTIIRSIKKVKVSNGIKKISKLSSSPENVIIYNGKLDEIPNEIKEKIDYNYYVEKIYKKLEDFI